MKHDCTVRMRGNKTRKTAERERDNSTPALCRNILSVIFLQTVRENVQLWWQLSKELGVLFEWVCNCGESCLVVQEDGEKFEWF